MWRGDERPATKGPHFGGRRRVPHARGSAVDIELPHAATPRGGRNRHRVSSGGQAEKRRRLNWPHRACRAGLERHCGCVMQDPDNKRNIIPDEKLAKVFGSKKAINMFEMTKKVSRHLS